MHETGLAVHVGHEEKGTLVVSQLRQHSRCDGLLRQRQSLSILGKGLRGPAMDVPGELIEHDDLGQTPPGAHPPRGQLTGRRLLQEPEESGSQQVIERRVDGPPVPSVGLLEPEGQDFLRRFHSFRTHYSGD